MPPSTRNHDPFVDAPRPPTSRTSHLQHEQQRQQQQQQDQEPHHGPLRATTTTTNGPARNFLGPPPAPSRRPTAASANRGAVNVTDSHVLEDAENGDHLTLAGPNSRRAATSRAGRTRRTRANTDTNIDPDAGRGRDASFVVRDKSGNYLPKMELPGGEIIVSEAEIERESLIFSP